MKGRSRTICGAKNRAGQPCRRAPCRGHHRCPMHGGKSLRGDKHPNWRHGIFSDCLTTKDKALWPLIRVDAIDDVIKLAMVRAARIATEQARLEAAAEGSAEGLPVEETTETVTPQGRTRSVTRKRRSLHKQLNDALRTIGDLIQIRHLTGAPADPAEIGRLTKIFMEQTEDIFLPPPEPTPPAVH